MDDLDRLFRHLVSVLADQSADRLHAPFEVAELYQQLVPYRQHRAALKFDTNQDYEMAVLRLLSGDRGYASVEPAEVQQVLRDEARSVNPDPGLFREFAAARVTLDAAAVRTALGARSAYAPTSSPPPTALAPPPPSQPTAQRQPPATPQPPNGMAASDHAGTKRGAVVHDPAVVGAVGGGGDAVGLGGAGGGAAVGGEVEGGTCPYCGQELPTQREAFYCPYCGGNVKGVECPKCGTGLEVGWTFCITCGQKVRS